MKQRLRTNRTGSPPMAGKVAEIMTRADNNILESKLRLETYPGQPMDLSHVTMCQKICLAARAFEKRRTKHGRDWVGVFMNEDTVVIALHGFLTAEEKTLAQSPAGVAKVRKLHEELFASLSGTLHRMITSITGAVVVKTTAEIEPTTGRVVHIFTTDAVEIDFLQTPRVLADTRGQGNTLLNWREGNTRSKLSTLDVTSRDDRPNSSERILR